MRRKLTATFIESVKPGPKRVEYFDAACIGLALMVTSTGHRSFTVRGRIRDGDRKSHKLATLPIELGLEKARKEARKVLELAAEGRDPREARRAAALAKAEAAADTLAAVTARYLKIEGRRGLRSLDQVDYTFRQYVLPALGTKPVSEIKRSDVAKLRDAILANGNDKRPRLRTAERAVAHLGLVLNWHAARHDSYINPLVRGAFRGEARKRDRTLTDPELRALWRATEPVPGRHAPYDALVRILLLTGRRKTEAAGMTWAEINSEGDHLLPASRHKTKVALLSPLSAAARAIIAAQPRLGPFVFSVFGPRPIADFAGAKRVLDRRMLAFLREEDLQAELPRWTLHDLRRSFRTLLARLRVPHDVAEAAIGHVLPGVAGIYDRFDRFDQKRAAVERLATEIARIAGVPVPTAIEPAVESEPAPPTVPAAEIATPWGIIHVAA